MESLMKELYCGNLEIDCGCGYTNAEYKRLNKEIADMQNKFIKSLSEKQSKEYCKLEEKINERDSCGAAESFVCGMKIGMRFIIEAFNTD